jgi:glutamyl-tRNA reductase
MSRAEALAKQYGGRAMALGDFVAAPPALSVLVTATAAPAPIFDAAFFAHCPDAPWIVDLAVGRDVDPEAARQAGAVLYDIDRLNDLANLNRQARSEQMAHARQLIDETLVSFRRRLLAREMAPVTQALRARYTQTLQTSLTQLFAKEMQDASPQMQDEITLWAKRLVNKLAHTPTDAVKQVGYAHGPDVVQTFLEAISTTSSAKGETKV